MSGKNEDKCEHFDKPLNADVEYHASAGKFLSEFVTDGFEEHLIEHFKKHNYNHNEKMLFRMCLASHIEFIATMASLKSDMP